MSSPFKSAITSAGRLLAWVKSENGKGREDNTDKKKASRLVKFINIRNQLRYGIMKPGNLLAILLASAVILSLAVVLVNKDALVSETEFGPPLFLSIREVDVKPVEVTSAIVEVNVTAYINQGGGKTRNASMLIRAIRSDTKLLEAQVFTPFNGTGSDKTLIVSQNLKVERNGGYELKILLFNNGMILDSGSVNIVGLNALTPQSKRSGIILNNMDFTVKGVSAGRVAIASDIYLENRGSQATENLNLIVKAREAASNLLADKTTSETGVIASESTAIKNVKLDVPDEYNYMVVVELWKGDVMINTWEKAVLLAPSKTVPKETVEKKVDIEVSKFVREGGAPEGVPPFAKPTPTPARKESGFEAAAAITALIIVLLLRRRS